MKVTYVSFEISLDGESRMLDVEKHEKGEIKSSIQSFMGTENERKRKRL
jgi:hypothetical protein